MNNNNPIRQIIKNTLLIIIINFLIFTIISSYSNNNVNKKSNTLENYNKNKTNFPKGTWLLNTISYEIIDNQILCGLILNNMDSDELHSLHRPNISVLIPNNKYKTIKVYTTDCIKFKKNDFIVIVNGKFRKKYFLY